MNAVATTLYRSPERIFSAADRGPVTIRRKGKDYLLTRKTAHDNLYGCLKNSIKADHGKPAVKWKAAG